MPDDLQIMLEHDSIEEDRISKAMLQTMLKLNSWFIIEDNEAKSLLLFNIGVQYQFFGIKIWVLCLKNHPLNLGIEIHGIRQGYKSVYCYKLYLCNQRNYIILYNIAIMNKQKQENKCPLRCASLRGVEFFPHGKREERERAQRLGHLFSCLYLTQNSLVFIPRIRRLANISKG